MIGKPFYKTWWGILLLFIFWPFSLTYWIWKRNWNLKLKLGFVIPLWFFIILVGFAKPQEQSNYNKNVLGQTSKSSTFADINITKTIIPTADNQIIPTNIPTAIIIPSNTPTPITLSTPKLTQKPTPVPLMGVSETIEQHCQTQWPNDASMKSYCAKQQNEAVAVLNKGKPQYVTDEQFNVIRTNCITKWSTDFEMRAYCEKQQYEAISGLNLGKPDYVTDEEYSITTKYCQNKWPTNFEMKNYCQKQQFQAITTLHLGKQSDTSEADFNNLRIRCTSKWPDDFEMRVYCEQNER